MSNYWEDKRVVLLGGASLIGTHLANRLIELNVRQLRIVDDFSSGRMSNVEHLKDEGVQIHNRELRDYFNAKNAVDRMDIVFHLASQHGGRGYVAGHAIELYNNLELDTTIFRACADKGVEKVIFSSSACAYPIDMQNKTTVPLYLIEKFIDYKDMRQADGPYGTEKLVAEQMLDAYIASGKFKGCSTRSFTVYGPLMKETHAIAALIAKVMLKQNPIEVWGTGSQIRNWTYVTDNVEGAILAAQHLDRGAINIGVEDRLTPIYAVNQICDIMGWWPDSVLYQKDKPVGPINRVADATKLKSLGWSPKYTFREGLEKTIEWYLQTHNVEELRENFERKLTER